MEEINKLAMRDETENTKLERLKRQAESLEEKEKPTQPTQAKPAPLAEGSPKSASSNLQLSFQKQFCVLGITLGILYKMSKY